jgi:hypothetical protein
VRLVAAHEQAIRVDLSEVSVLDSGGVGHGFLRDTNNTYTVIDYPGASASAAHGISDTGVITGDYYRNGHYHGFILKSGVYSTINYPKAAT